MTRRLLPIALICLWAIPATVPGAPKKLLRDQPLSDTFIIETNHGTITIQLDAEKAPLHTANFATYADAKFYDGLIFHRVIKDFMIQAGGHEESFAMKEAKGAKVKNESLNGLKNLRGTLAAARTNDPDSAAAQFFINLKDNAFLDGDLASKKPGYSVFGKVTSGMDVVDKIAAVKTGSKNGHGDVPTENVVIKSVKRAQ